MHKSAPSFKLFLSFLSFFSNFAPVQSGVILAIETSVETGSVALVSEEGVIMEREFHAGRKPSSTLWPALEEVMAEAESLSAVVVGTGPGSYNGARVGIAAGQGIALIQGCPTVGLCSFEGVALQSSSALAIGDARRGSFSTQALADGRLKGEVSLLPIDELQEAISHALTDGAEVFCFEEVSRFPLPDEIRAQVNRKQSQAGNLALAYWRRSEEERAQLLEVPLQPNYLRDPHITVSKRRSLL